MAHLLSCTGLLFVCLGFADTSLSSETQPKRPTQLASSTCPQPKDEPGLGVGVSSLLPVGTGSGAFQRVWGTILAVSAGKSIPLAWDMNGDGHVDIAVNGRGMQDAGLYTATGDGSFKEVAYLSAGGGGGALILALSTRTNSLTLQLATILRGPRVG